MLSQSHPAGQFDPQINIIYGPNECGKSTLITCLARAFSISRTLEHRRSRASALEDGSLPEVSVEFL